MKKVFSLIVIALLAFALTACAGAKNECGGKRRKRW